MNKQELIDFENRVQKEYETGYLGPMIHLCGGNEDNLIDIFKDIKKEDWVFSTHRNHYHYLMKTGKTERLMNDIKNNRSMFVFDKEYNFYSSSIVCGTPCIAAGVALSIKLSGKDNKVYCFIGDGAEDEGHLYEAVRLVDSQELPCIFIIEDNDRSVDANKKERWGSNKTFNWPSCVKRYTFNSNYPHSGNGKNIQFKSL